MTFRCEPLGAQDLADFDCGNDELSTWLIRRAHTATGHGTRTTIVIDDETGCVAGYFSIAPHLLEREALPRSVARGAPREISLSYSPSSRSRVNSMAAGSGQSCSS